MTRKRTGMMMMMNMIMAMIIRKRKRKGNRRKKNRKEGQGWCKNLSGSKQTCKDRQKQQPSTCEASRGASPEFISLTCPYLRLLLRPLLLLLSPFLQLPLLLLHFLLLFFLAFFSLLHSLLIHPLRLLSLLFLLPLSSSFSLSLSLGTNSTVASLINL